MMMHQIQSYLYITNHYPFDDVGQNIYEFEVLVIRADRIR